jgi:PqqD family protein of HPr-rel-A system
MLVWEDVGHFTNSLLIESLRITLTTRCTLVKRRWADEVVVFDELTGDTHLLGGLGGQIFEFIYTARDKDQETSMTELSSVTEVGSSLEEINRAVAELRMLGLVM